MSFRKAIKRIQRKRLALHAKVGKVAIPIVAAGVSYYAGPVAGEAVAYAGTRVQKRAAEAGYRGSDRQLSSHERSQKARAVANRTFKYSQIGVGVGTATSGIVAATQGSSFWGSLGKAAFGQAGSNLLGVGKVSPKAGTAVDFDQMPLNPRFDPETGLEYTNTGPLGTTDYTQSGSEAWKTPPGLGGSGPTTGAAGQNSHSWFDQVMGGLGTMIGGVKKDPGEKGSGKPGWDMTDPLAFNQPGGGNVQGEEGGLLQNPLVLGALAVGAVLLLRKK